MEIGLAKVEISGFGGIWSHCGLLSLLALGLEFCLGLYALLAFGVYFGCDLRLRLHFGIPLWIDF